MAASYDPSGNAAAIAAEWKRLGWSDVSIKGMLARAKRESSFNTAARNPGDASDGSDSVGLFQWNRERLTNLKKKAEDSNFNPEGRKFTDPVLQARYTDWEINHGPEQATGRRLREATTVHDAVNAAMLYTRPKGSMTKVDGKWVGTPEKGMHYKETLQAAGEVWKPSQKPGEEYMAQDATNKIPRTTEGVLGTAEAILNTPIDTTTPQTQGMLNGIGNLVNGLMPKEKQMPAAPTLDSMANLFKPRLTWAGL